MRAQVELFFNTNLGLDSFYFSSWSLYSLASKCKVNHRILLNDSNDTNVLIHEEWSHPQILKA